VGNWAGRAPGGASRSRRAPRCMPLPRPLRRFSRLRARTCVPQTRLASQMMAGTHSLTHSLPSRLQDCPLGHSPHWMYPPQPSGAWGEARAARGPCDVSDKGRGRGRGLGHVRARRRAEPPLPAHPAPRCPAVAEPLLSRPAPASAPAPPTGPQMVPAGHSFLGSQAMEGGLQVSCASLHTPLLGHVPRLGPHATKPPPRGARRGARAARFVGGRRDCRGARS
jgi:hypothetical protein